MRTDALCRQERPGSLKRNWKKRNATRAIRRLMRSVDDILQNPSAFKHVKFRLTDKQGKSHRCQCFIYSESETLHFIASTSYHRRAQVRFVAHKPTTALTGQSFFYEILGSLSNMLTLPEIPLNELTA